MKFDTANLRNGDQALDPVHLEVRLFVAEHSDEFQQVRRARHRVTLEELLAANPVGRANDRAWAPFDMLDQP